MQTALNSESVRQKPWPEAYTLKRGDALSAPVIFASPHSGQIYPQHMVDILSVPLSDLQRTEDAFVNELYEAATVQGAVILSATFARGFVDLNRDARELDAAMFHDGLPRVAGMPSAGMKDALDWKRSMTDIMARSKKRSRP